MSSVETGKEFPDYRPFGRTFCSFSVPLNRRIETLSALIHSSSIILLPCLYFYLWTRLNFWPFLIIYTGYTYFLDDTVQTGRSIYRCSTWLKKCFLYKGFVDYFPIITHRTVPLPPTIEKRKELSVCFPTWTQGLPSKVCEYLHALKLISKKERVIESEQRVGPRYMFVSHPHGVISFGITGAMCWDGESEVYDTELKDEGSTGELAGSVPTGDTSNPVKVETQSKLKSSRSFKSLFPGINAHLLTLSAQLIMPFYRDYLMCLGVGLVTKKSIHSILSRWHSVTIVVGGAHESLLSRPGMNRLILNKRKGFVKIALEACNKSEKDMEGYEDTVNSNVKNGHWDNFMSDIAMVPIYVYGENNIHNVYNTTKHSTRENRKHSYLLKIFLKFQLFLKNITGFTIPLVNSRSIFNYDFGLLPYKRRVDVVVGSPIYVYRKFGASPGDPVQKEEVDFFHELYKSKLFELWKKNKAFSTKWDEDLMIVE